MKNSFFSKKARVVDDAMAEAKSSQPDFFSRLPKVLREEVLSYTPVRSKEVDANGKPLPATGKQVSVVSKHLSALFRPNLLCDRVVCGDLKVVESILKKAELQPQVLRDLLLKKREVTNYSGQAIMGTALQIAWGAEDPEMIDAIQKALLTLPGGEEIIKAQYAKQFPEGWQEKEEKEWAPIQEAMRDAFDAIERAQDADVTWDRKNKKITIHDEALKASVENFRTLLAEQMKKPVKTGRHFNSLLWLEAAEICNDVDRWGRRGGLSSRNRLANCQLYGFIQRYLPSWCAMATAQGLYFLTEKSEKLRRFSIYPLNSNSGWVLGENCYARGRWRPACLSWGRGAGNVVQSFCRSTTADLQNLRDLGQLNPKTLNRCTLL